MDSHGDIYHTRLAVVEVGSDVSVTYGELVSKAELIAGQLLKLGCRRGDVIAIFSPNSIDWILVCLAVLRIGVTVAGINCLLTESELRDQLQTCSANYVFTTRNLASMAVLAAKRVKAQALVNGGGCDGCVDIGPRLVSAGQFVPRLPSFHSLGIQLDDVAVIFFSSGTTGRQKGVMLSHRTLQYQLLMSAHPKCFLLVKSHVIFTPISHISAFVFAVIGIGHAATNYVMPKFDLDTFFRTLEERKIQQLLVVPPVATMMVKSPISHRYRLRHLKDLVVGAAPLSAELEELLLEKYPWLQIRQAYGMTEMAGAVAAVPFEAGGLARKPGSIGVPLRSVQMKVINPDTGEDVGPGTRGEVCVKSPVVMLGYVGNPEATAAAIDSSGWLHTGDVGYYDADGSFFIVDRLKELIKYNAYQVAPAELEAVLLSHADVADAAVMGLPDSKHGELPLAWVVRKPSATVTQLQLKQFVDERVAPYKRLRGGVQFVTAIPKTASGKILRRQMKATLLDGKL